MVLDFVETYFGASDLEHFKKFFSLTIDHSSDPIVKAGGLQAMLACFLKGNKEVLKDFKQHIAKKNGKADENGKKKAKKVESSDEEESSSSAEEEASSSSSSEDEKPAPKKVVGGKRKAKESSSSSDGESSEDEKPPKKRKRTESISSRTRSNSDVINAPKKAPKVPKGPIIPMKF